jgi:hypothetical protein
VKPFVTDISASTGRNDFIFDMWLLHGDLYCVSTFQVYRTSTSCLQCDLKFFMLAVMKTFVTDISASTGRNDFIFDMWLLHGDLYRVSTFQVYRTSTSCLQCDLKIFMLAVMQTFVTDIHKLKNFVITVTWKGETRYKSPCKSHISNIKSFLPVEAEISVTKVFITANMKIFKSHCKQEVDVWYRVSPFQVTVITKFFSLWLHKSLLCTFQPVYNDLY